MQLKLGFLELPDPTTPAGNELDPEARRAFVHALAKVIAQAICRPRNEDVPEDHDDR
ncbi:MAG TPA: hypothetical protein VJ386_04220 [Candidatus Deferrimicrobiaceae bacterium]|nr:hypothetical protein [Candidatus Deferrimicrobiaceae bacterium]